MSSLQSFPLNSQHVPTLTSWILWKSLHPIMAIYASYVVDSISLSSVIQRVNWTATDEIQSKVSASCPAAIQNTGQVLGSVQTYSCNKWILVTVHFFMVAPCSTITIKLPLYTTANTWQQRNRSQQQTEAMKNTTKVGRIITPLSTSY